MTSAVAPAEVVPPHDRYKWIALSNTTLGVLMVTINTSILLISLPDIFRGIKLAPLAPGNTSYFLWILMGFLLVTAVLVVSFGRVGDMYGRVRIYNLGFAIFTLFSILLSVTWMTGPAGALWIIIMRLGQGVGGAFLFANSSAILTDAFPENERGMAMGINGVALVTGSFLGLILGGVLAPIQWHLVFLVSVPFGLFGTIWAFLMLKDNGVRTPSQDRLAGQRHLRHRPGRRPGGHRLRHPALRRPHHGLDQPLRAVLCHRGRGAARGLRAHRVPGGQPHVPAPPVPDPGLHGRRAGHRSCRLWAGAACSSC